MTVARSFLGKLHNGLIAESIQHAFRGDDPHRAATLLDASRGQLNQQGVFQSAKRWAASILAAILDEYPGIQLWRAWYLMCERRYDESRPLPEAVAVAGVNCPVRRPR